MRNDRERLSDILEAIRNIEKYAGAGKEPLQKDELLQVWMVHHIQIIGEASSGVTPGLRAHYPDVPWENIIAMRNVLVHQYFGIDVDQLWDTILTDLPGMKKRVGEILDGLA